MLEYGDIVWDNCGSVLAEKIESVQKRAARIVSGALIRTPTVLMYDELGWESLSIRRKKKRLCTYYKILNNESPKYLSDLLPDRVNERTTINLRNSQNTSRIGSRTETFLNTFFPRTIREFNELPNDFKQSTSLAQFKSKLNADRITVKPWFSVGNRALSMIHSRMRMHCSPLKADLKSLNIIDNAYCNCGNVP